MSDPVALTAAGSINITLSDDAAPMVASVVLLDPIAAPADAAAMLPDTADIALWRPRRPKGFPAALRPARVRGQGDLDRRDHVRVG